MGRRISDDIDLRVFMALFSRRTVDRMLIENAAFSTEDSSARLYDGVSPGYMS